MKIVFDESGNGQTEETVEKAVPATSAIAEATPVSEKKDVAPAEVLKGIVSHQKVFVHIAEVVAVLLLIGGAAGYFLFRDKGAGTIVFEAPETKTEATPEAPPPKPEDIVIVNDTDGVQGSATENIATADPKIFSAPENFKSFQYSKEEGKTLLLSGICRDAYYAVLVFDKNVDYRTNPAASRVNTAYECPASKKFSFEVSLQDFNLPDGSYYVFIADQGNTGSWYNPR